jgi:D-3-phosphoglycerate dehydrogenase
VSARVLVSAPYILPVIDRFRAAFERRGIELVLPSVGERLEEHHLLPLVGDIDGVICGDDRFTRRVIESAPRLRVISKWGTGVDSIDATACAERGVAVRRTENAFSEPVADSVMGYCLSFARGIPWADGDMKQGLWQKRPGRALRECALGIIGVGNIGRAVGRRAAAFGMRILGTDPIVPSPEVLESIPIEMVEFGRLIRESDFISLNCDLNPTSFHLLDTPAFQAMKPTAVVINTARGSVIDEPALVRALEQGAIAGAALDVFEDEPLPVDSPLRQMTNVLLAPHNANSSAVAWEHVHENTLRNLFEVLDGQ